MKCKRRVDPREVLRRIIKNTIQKNLQVIDGQLKSLGTYDAILWENVANGFIRAVRFMKIGSRILEDEKFTDEMNSILLSLYTKSLNSVYRSRNPPHKARALFKIARAGAYVGYEKLDKLLEDGLRIVDSIDDLVNKTKTISYMLFEIGKMISTIKKRKDLTRDKILERIESIAQEAFKKAISWIEIIETVQERAKALSYLAEGIRDLSIVVKTDTYGMKWLDTHEAEALANKSLEESIFVEDEFSRGLIKTYVAYLYYTLSIELREKAENLFDDAIEIALKLLRENPKKAGEMLGEIAFTKALLGMEEEAEALFQEACIITLKCPEIDNILTALKIAELAGKGRLLRTVSELLGDYILQIIRELDDEISMIALQAIAADIAIWVDFGWGARLAINAAEELWAYEPYDISNGKQIYLLALGAQKSAFAEPEAAWRIFEFIISGLKNSAWDDIFFVRNISLEWLGRAYSALKEIPIFYEVLEEELLKYLSRLSRILHKEVFAIELTNLATGIGRSNRKLSVSFIEKAIQLAKNTSAETSVFGKAIQVLEKLDENLYENYINEIIKRAELKASLEETIDYLNGIIKGLKSMHSKTKIAKVIVDIITEASASDIVDSPAVKRFLKTLRRIDKSWANEIEELVDEVRRYSRFHRKTTKRTIRYGEKKE